MTDKLLLDIMDTKGDKQQIEVIFAFELDQKQYIVYTKNEQRENDTVLLYASAMVIRDTNIVLENITDEEWLLVKNKMRDSIHTNKEGVA